MKLTEVRLELILAFEIFKRGPRCLISTRLCSIIVPIPMGRLSHKVLTYALANTLRIVLSRHTRQ